MGQHFLHGEETKKTAKMRQTDGNGAIFHRLIFLLICGGKITLARLLYTQELYASAIVLSNQKFNIVA
jgi:hypothetical protein